MSEEVANSSAEPNVGASADDQKQCWVCFASADDDRSAQWVKPCKCRGTTKWVHQNCLQRWVDEKQKGNTFAKVTCSQCGTEYLILYPPLGFFTMTLENIDRLVSKVCPMVVGSLLVGTVYGALVFYGGVTVFVVIGHREGLALMEPADPMVLLIGLPIIPIALIFGQMFKWEDEVVRILARLTLKSASAAGAGAQQAPAVRDQTSSATRILCSAMALPLISKLVGKWLFDDYVTSPVLKTLLGGAVFLTVKGVANVYFKYQQLWRRQRRVILDYYDDKGVNASSSTNTGANRADLIQP